MWLPSLRRAIVAAIIRPRLIAQREILAGPGRLGRGMRYDGMNLFKP